MTIEMKCVAVLCPQKGTLHLSIQWLLALSDLFQTEEATSGLLILMPHVWQGDLSASHGISLKVELWENGFIKGVSGHVSSLKSILGHIFVPCS